MVLVEDVGGAARGGQSRAPFEERSSRCCVEVNLMAEVGKPIGVVCLASAWDEHQSFVYRWMQGCFEFLWVLGKSWIHGKKRVVIGMRLARRGRAPATLSPQADGSFREQGFGAERVP